MNNINFPAGILQPPFFDNDMDDAVNFGGIGMVIGHELTHGFDDQGRQFDAKGNLHDWWTPEDAKEFEERAACVAQEYSKFEVAPGANVNGELTLGENTADNGGARIALMALENTLASKSRPEIGGFTPEQRFFLSFGQIWCENDARGGGAAAGADRPALPGAFPRERRGAEYAGVPEGFLVQGGSADGSGERLPGLVGSHSPQRR